MSDGPSDDSSQSPNASVVKKKKDLPGGVIAEGEMNLIYGISTPKSETPMVQ